MESQSTYGIIGAGAIGQALGATLRRGGKEVQFWDRDETKSSVKTVAELAKSSSVIILAIPSVGVREATRKLKQNLGHGHLVLTVAKGVEDGFVTMDAVLEDELAGLAQYGVMCGPMLAGELIANEGGYATLATTSPQPSIIADCKAGALILEQSTELKAVATCSVLKNVYALGLGVADSLDLSMNSKAALTVNMTHEMRSVLRQLQLDQEIALGYSGLGDLLATGWGDASYNHHVGEEVGAGKLTGLTGEGHNALMQIDSVLDLASFPILNCLHHIIVSKAPADELLDTLSR